MVQRFLLALILLAAIQTQAKTTQYKPLKIGVNQGDRLEIQGYNGRVKLVAKPNSSVMVVHVAQQTEGGSSLLTGDTVDEWLFSFQKNGQTIEVSVRGPQSKNQWSQLISGKKIPQYHIEIHSPAIPATIHWNEGPITVSQWNADFRVNQNGGGIFLNDTAGEADLLSQSGQILVSRHEGHLGIENYAGKVKLDKIKGQIKVENFIGSTDIEGSEAQMRITSFKGPSSVTKSKGRLEFENGRSILKVSRFEGEIKGKSGQGAVIASVIGEADVRVTTEEGAVSLKAAGSGAWVNAGTTEGHLFLPNHLKLTHLPNLKLMRGRLKGSSGGTIFVRTESGNIRIR